MKRCWIGVGLLLVLLGGGIFTTWKMDALHRPMSEQIRQASDLAEEGNWEGASEGFSGVKGQWEENWGFSASLADHEPMEEINSLLSQLEVSLKARDPLSFRLLCAQLEQALDAMGEAHRLAWWNLL